MSITPLLNRIDIKWKAGTLSADQSLCNTLTIQQLLLHLYSPKDKSPSFQIRLCNTLLKIIEATALDATEQRLYNQQIINEISNIRNLFPTPDISMHYVNCNDSYKDITVLFYEGPIARAYLETLKSMGIKPKKIYHLISNQNLTTKKPIPRWLPNRIQIQYARALQERMMHFWSRKISLSHPNLVQSIMTSIESDFKFTHEIQLSSRNMHSLSRYTQNIHEIYVSDMNDPLIINALKHESGLVLFTGGGYLSPTLLSSLSCQLIHIHPGFLPDIRGADGALWSLLTHNRLSASAFFMSDGIDQGNIIYPCWLPDFKLMHHHSQYDTLTLYRSLYAYIDPWVRSYVLRQLIAPEKGFNIHLGHTQKAEQGQTFYFMHSELQKMAFDNLFSANKL